MKSCFIRLRRLAGSLLRRHIQLFPRQSHFRRSVPGACLGISGNLRRQSL